MQGWSGNWLHGRDLRAQVYVHPPNLYDLNVLYVFLLWNTENIFRRYFVCFCQQKSVESNVVLDPDDFHFIYVQKTQRVNHLNDRCMYTKVICYLYSISVAVLT